MNACVVLEEYEGPGSQGHFRKAGPCLFTLSAKNEDRLRECVNRLLIYLRSEQDIDLTSLCYTLHVGREEMEERLAVVAAGASELIDRLGAWSKQSPSDTIYRGSLASRRGSRRSSKLAKTTIDEQSLNEIASAWVAGEEVDWESKDTGFRTLRFQVSGRFPTTNCIP